MSGKTRDTANSGTGKNRPRPEAPVAEERPASFGTWLRRQREVREISLREISDATKISYRYLEAFEQDRFDILPAHVFARGFLQEYAEYVGLDPAEVINNYLAAQAAEAPEGEKVEPKSARSLGPNWWGSVALVAGTVAVIGLIAWIAFAAARHREQSRPPVTAAPVPAPVELPPVGQRAASSGPESSASSASPTSGAALPSANPAVGDSRTTPGVVSGAAAAEPVSPAAGSAQTLGTVAGNLPSETTAGDAPLKVTLDFAQNCWVDATIDGKRRVQQEHAEGETLALEATTSVRLTLGNAGGVEVRVNGRRLDLGKGPGEVARDVLIDLETLRKLNPGP